MTLSCATWFREPSQAWKESAVSGCPGSQAGGPEWSAVRAPVASRRDGVRDQQNPGPAAGPRRVTSSTR